MIVRLTAAACAAMAWALAALLSASPSHASESLPAALACTFDRGSSVAYAVGSYDSSPAQPLSFDIAGIDLDRQLAVLQTASGKGALRIVRAVNANHFLEVVTEGFLNLTTVYDLDEQRKSYPAVHSRHLGLLGEPVVAQYYGFCTPR